jgi:hypothetical protein
MLDTADLLHYYKIGLRTMRSPEETAAEMAVHQPHSHPVGQRHEPARVSPSILRMSVWERLIVVAVAVLVLWAAVYWAVVR